MFSLSRWLGAVPCSLCHAAPAEPPHPLCLGCARDVPWRGEVVQVQGLQVQVAYDYAWPIDRVIHRYKYQRQLALARLLGGGLLQLARPDVDALLAVPLSPARLRLRGFNQSHELAKPLSVAWQLPLLDGVVRSAGVQQQGLSRSERLLNLEGAFRLRSDCPPMPERVALLDDVLTTGSTLLHLANFLKAEGVREVCALVVASAKRA